MIRYWGDYDPVANIKIMSVNPITLTNRSADNLIVGRGSNPQSA